MRISVLGAGTWGTALGRALSLNHHEVCIWSRFEEEISNLSTQRSHPHLPGTVIPDSIRFTADIPAAAEKADMILLVVPSIFTRETIRDFAPYIPPEAILISAGKGIESATLMTLTEVIRDELTKAGKMNPVVALSGPTHAEEVARDLPTLIVSASDNLDAARTGDILHHGTAGNPEITGAADINILHTAAAGNFQRAALVHDDVLGDFPITDREITGQNKAGNIGVFHFESLTLHRALDVRVRG